MSLLLTVNLVTWKGAAFGPWYLQPVPLESAGTPKGTFAAALLRAQACVAVTHGVSERPKTNMAPSCHLCPDQTPLPAPVPAIDLGSPLMLVFSEWLLRAWARGSDGHAAGERGLAAKARRALQLPSPSAIPLPRLREGWLSAVRAPRHRTF